jgi:hypothetical protein
MQSSAFSFAKAWDAKNPSAFKCACEESRQMREDHAYRTQQRNKAGCAANHFLFQPSAIPVAKDEAKAAAK